MWQKNLLFAFVVVLGIACIVRTLMPDRRPAWPESFHASTAVDSADRQIVGEIDRQFRAHWQAQGLRPAPRAGDLTICRRLSLALTGTIPSLEDIRAIEAQPPDNRILWWLSHLLQDRRYHDYVAERLARVYVGVEDGPFLVYRRRRFVIWLADHLETNTPYDQLARHLVADQGLWTDSPAVNFVTVTLDQNNDNQPDPIRLARRVSRALLGVRLDCVQCHDDQLDGEWLQSDFHELAAFFSDARQTGVGVRDEDHRYLYKYLDADEEVTVPAKVPFFTEAHQPEGTRREQLARWVTAPENKAFARTAVGRVWALLFGQPLFDAVDSIPLDGPYPPGFETLAEDFTSHGYDLRRLIRVIAATEVFQRDSRAEHEITPKYEADWAVFPLTRLRPEQISDSVLQSASLQTIDSESHILVRIARGAQQQEFVGRYGDTGEDEFGAHGGTIPQRLLMLNGDLVRERSEENLVGNAATRIAALAATADSALTSTYLAILTRKPSAAENEYFLAKRRSAPDVSQRQFIEDLYWTLLNSTEFSWNH